MVLFTKISSLYTKIYFSPLSNSRRVDGDGDGDGGSAGVRGNFLFYQT